MSLLRLSGIEKRFAGTHALKGISLELAPGEAAGLIGENGAGKSTLIKILAGVHRPDGGTIDWLGAPAAFANPQAALLAGIATIHQELACFDRLTVAENMMLGEAWPRHRWGGVHWRALNKEVERRLHAFGLDISAETFFHKLSPAQRQEVAIARAFGQNARLLILDEPTASLTEPEVERLTGHLRKLKERGVAFLYVSHRLDEILALTERVLVLRDGALVAEYPTGEATIERMVRDMVGRELGVLSRRPAPRVGPVVFEARSLGRAGMFEDISFTLRAGEILGLGGLVGAGRSEFARALFGLYAPSSGSAFLKGKPWLPKSAAAARAHGVVYVPEERKRQGFVLEHSTGTSISIGFLERLGAFGWIGARRERESVASAIQRFGVKVTRLDQPIGTLSGGNQQKALLARWLDGDPDLVILDEPTRGVDVGAKAEIHGLIQGLAARGKAVLLMTSDLPELLALSDRIVVLHRGKISAALNAAGATQEEVLLAASGLRAE